MKQPNRIDVFVNALFVSGALVDADGLILEVNDGWRKFAELGKLKLSNYGVGTNYLKYCVFPDPASVAILLGLKRVIDKKVDLFSTLYPCNTPMRRKWFLLTAFAIDRSPPAVAAVLHLDVSSMLRTDQDPSASMVGIGAAAMDPTFDALATIIRESIGESIRATSPVRSEPTSAANDGERLSRLTYRQRSILRELGKGASNAEIADVCGITLSTAKAQTAALIRRLGLKNRVQAALFAVRHKIVELD